MAIAVNSTKPVKIKTQGNKEKPEQVVKKEDKK